MRSLPGLFGLQYRVSFPSWQVRLFLLPRRRGVTHHMIMITYKKRVRQMEYTKEDCIALLRSVSARLAEAGDGRLPRRSDFSEREVCAIKAHLGPWPRALEAAGLKSPREGDRLERNREKRIRAARRINAARREAKKAAAAGSAASATAAEAPKEQE